MKYILPLITALLLTDFAAFSQSTDTAFQKQWNAIDTLIVAKDRPKTALIKVTAIYNQAQALHLDAQVIKALLYKLSLQEKVSEQDINAVAKTYDAEIVDASNPVQQSILCVLKATALENYFNQNRWRVRNRKNSSNSKKDDITLWTGADFYKAISALYTMALQPAEVLQKTSTQKYTAVIIKGNAPQLRPTLYDLLANMAIDFYNLGRIYDIGASNIQRQDDTMLLAPLNEFIAYDFKQADTSSYLLNALMIYQNIEIFHKNNNDTAALLDADINRINLGYEYATFSNKVQFYTQALEAITYQYANHPQAAQAWYLLLEMPANKAKNYKPFEDTANRYAYVPIHQKIVERLKAQPVTSEGNSNMRQLLDEIEEKELSTQAESINLPYRPFRLLVQYKNIDTLYGRIVSRDVFYKNYGGDDAVWRHIQYMTYKHSFVQRLPQADDYQKHSVEIKIDALPPGQYVLLGSSTKDFLDSTGKLIAQPFTVSHLALIHNGDDYFVLDRESGLPINGVKVQITVNHRNSGVRRSIPVIVTKDDGYFHFQADEQKVGWGEVSIKLIDGKDVLDDDGNNYYYGSYQNSKTIPQSNNEFEKSKATIHFYLDRAIYRPGQKVFFKGIITTEDALTHKPKLYKTTDSLHIYLRDVNYKTIDSSSSKLNDYGAFIGSFELPLHALTGDFSMAAKDFANVESFRVEEYKRPTFYVQLDTLKSTYRLRDTISVTGFAQAFAGNFLNNARVKYTVQRKTRFTYHDWYRKTPLVNDMQIAEGTVTSDGNGKFSIKFLALPDESVDTSTNLMFDFALNATVTDGGGETRQADTKVSVGYASLTVKLDLPGVVERNALENIPVSVKNLSGEPIGALVHINVYPLQWPSRTVHSRYWERPDVFVMDKQEFVRDFPYDEYENESDAHTWPRLAAVISDTFSTSVSISGYTLNGKTLPQGRYMVEALVTGKDGRTVKDVAYTGIYDNAAHEFLAGEENFNAAEKNALQPGGKASMLIGSCFNEVFTLTYVDKSTQKNIAASGVPAYKAYLLDNSKIYIEEPVTEEDRGGFGLSYAFVKHNRFYNGNQPFAVPWNNKQLHIQYTTYRNKTEPGSKEQWTVKIKGTDSGKAELLTGMYDASLDQFAAHNWIAPNLWRAYYGRNNWKANAGFEYQNCFENNDYASYEYYKKQYDELASTYADIKANPGAWVADSAGVLVNSTTANYVYSELNMPTHLKIMPLLPDADGDGVTYEFDLEPNTPPGVPVDSHGRAKAGGYYKEGEMFVHARAEPLFWMNPNNDVYGDLKPGHPANNPPPLQLRTNFNETAFFFPQVYADSAGNYNIQFTMPESLTKWKWMSLAHTLGLSFGTNEATIITQKTLMVQPNMPRFLREGDKIELTARISNIGDTALTGQASLELIDASTGNPVDGLFQNVFPNQYFTAEAGQTTVLKFPVVIPNNYYHPLTYRVIAKTNGFNDGEENTLPVLTNRMLVTESLPLYIKGDTTKHFSFDKLLNTKSETLQSQSLTIEYTANPVWSAIQSLPYIMEYPYECAEQTFNRFYGNSLAAYIIQQHPRIKQVFTQWVADSTALQSNLDKNPELKQIILAETPWVLDEQNEKQQKKNLALLFDVVAMGNNTQSALQKLQDMQLTEGGFAWFKGGYADRYITQYILTGIGRLQQLHAVPAEQSTALAVMAAKAMDYLDDAANNDYNNLIKYKAKMEEDNLSQTAIQYLYMRSYFSAIAIKNKTAYNYFYQQAMKYWQHQSIYMKGMIALTMLHTNQQDYVARNIYPSIMENAVATEEKGMYWKDNQWGYYWYQSPVEQQALLMELAQAMASVKMLHTQKDADELKTWLINQKQTTNWKTTKATADACYALLLNSGTQLEANRTVTIQTGNETINSNDEKAETGTGYFKHVIDGNEVVPGMGKITVAIHSAGAIKNTGPSWGAVYWQYLEDMDKITGAATPLSLHKQLFIERATTAGKVLTPVTNDSVLHVGDKVVVRIELKSDRDMEYLHLKDMRAASMEPVNVLSEYKWQDGLGYYESTKDAATDFFISSLPKGSYIFEYPVYITHIGEFSVGIATIQCMYAPEFASHSEGVRVVVE